MPLKQLTKQIFDNRILNILFNPNISISRREYWAALVFIFLCTTLHLSETAFGGALNSFFYQYEIEKYLLVQQVFNPFLPNFIPYSAILLYASFVVSYKRCKTIGLDGFRWVAGLLTFLLLSTPGAALMLGAMDFGHQINNAFISDLNIVMCVISAVGILTVLLLSFGGSLAVDEKKETANGSINFLFKLFLLWVVGGLAMLIYLFSVDFSLAKSGNEIPIYVITAIIMIIYIGQIVLRATDAGLHIVIPLCIIVLTPIVLGTFYLSADRFHEPIGQNIFVLLTKIILAIVNMLFLILISLPSKVNNGSAEGEIKSENY